MALDLDRAQREPDLGEDFSRRLEDSLHRADRERRRRRLAERGRLVLLWVLLIGPVIGWRLTLSSADGVHLGVGALAWITFILDIGVHVDGSLLSYLGLQVLPFVIGVLLFVLVTATLLLPSREPK